MKTILLILAIVLVLALVRAAAPPTPLKQATILLKHVTNPTNTATAAAPVAAPRASAAIITPAPTGVALLTWTYPSNSVVAVMASTNLVNWYWRTNYPAPATSGVIQPLPNVGQEFYKVYFAQPGPPGFWCQSLSFLTNGL